MAITLISHPNCYRHLAGDDHPEQPARLSAINDQLIRSGMEFVVQQRDATAASKSVALDATLTHQPQKPPQVQLVSATNVWLQGSFSKNRLSVRQKAK